MTIWFLLIETAPGTGVFNHFAGFPTLENCTLVRGLLLQSFMGFATNPASLMCEAIAPGMPV